VVGDPLPQIVQIGGGIPAVGAPGAATAKPVEESQIDLTPFAVRWHVSGGWGPHHRFR
jgi:hypothetical protein